MAGAFSEEAATSPMAESLLVAELKEPALEAIWRKTAALLRKTSPGILHVTGQDHRLIDETKESAQNDSTTSASGPAYKLGMAKSRQ